MRSPSGMGAPWASPIIVGSTLCLLLQEPRSMSAKDEASLNLTRDVVNFEVTNGQDWSVLAIKAVRMWRFGGP